MPLLHDKQLFLVFILIALSLASTSCSQEALIQEDLLAKQLENALTITDKEQLDKEKNEEKNVTAVIEKKLKKDILRFIKRKDAKGLTLCTRQAKDIASIDKIFKEAILSLAQEILQTGNRKLSESSFKFLASWLASNQSTFETKALQELQKGLSRLCYSSKRKKGVGPIKEFIQSLKRYVPRKRDYHIDSEGDSESENPTIVYRALNQQDLNILQGSL
jgi:hypothetical protein